jgi:sialate O-acetylesterase
MSPKNPRIVEYPCPQADLWVLAGQSNMEGAAPLARPAAPQARLWCYGLDERWRRAVDPLHDCFAARLPAHRRILLSRGFAPELLDALAARGRRATIRAAGPGSFFGRFLLRHLPARRNVALLPCALGGTTLEEWGPDFSTTPGDSLYSAMVLRVRNSGLRPRGVLWYQGESDAQPGPSRLYLRRLLMLIDRLRADLAVPDLPFLMVQIGRTAGDSEGQFQARAWQRVREAQRRATQLRAGVHLTTAIDGTLSDWIHADLATQRVLGERLARLALTHVYQRGNWGDTIQPAEIRVGLHPWNHPLLHFDFPVLHLRFAGVQGRLRAAGAPAGFNVKRAPRGNGGALDIWRTELNPDGPGTVRLYLNTLPDVARIGVGYGEGFNPYCNITDEAGMALPAFDPIWVSYPRPAGGGVPA